MDILTDVLSTTHLRNVCHGPVLLGAPWGFRRDTFQGRYAYLIVTEGRCLLDIDDYGSLWLERGSVVFLTMDHGHSLRDSESSGVVSLEEFRLTRKEDRNGFEQYGGDGRRTAMVWGGFSFDDGSRNPLFASLPSVIHIQSSHEEGRWLESCIKYLTEEVTTKPPGYELIANRLIDILFVQAVRTMFLDAEAQGLRGWGCSLMDPQISRALGAIHADPSRDWTVATLAREAGMSRSGFAARFADCVGSSPGSYLTSWRMQKAADLLRTSHSRIDDIATQSGYASEASFVRAFKRSFGETPQAYRRAEQHGKAVMPHAS